MLEFKSIEMFLHSIQNWTILFYAIDYRIKQMIMSYVE